MGMTKGRACRGQMTVELVVALPALIIVAVIAVNVLTFLVDCAEFDRVAHSAVRIHAVSPAGGQGPAQSCANVQGEIESALDARNLSVSVSHSSIGADLDEYRATLRYSPTLFGMGMRSSVFGVAMPELVHETTYVVDAYKPGVIW